MDLSYGDIQVWVSPLMVISVAFVWGGVKLLVAYVERAPVQD